LVTAADAEVQRQQRRRSISSHRLASDSPLREIRKTVAPAWAARRAVDKPIPEVAPGMTITCSRSDLSRKRVMALLRSVALRAFR